MRMCVKLWLLFCIFGSLVAAEHERRNVLLICVDDLKPALGCYGDKRAKTPNIDRLAASGLLFESAYCNQAVCAPSRNALLTGLRPTTSGIYDLGTNFRKANPDAVTLPQAFKQAGYRTEGLGKIFHVGHGNVEDPASWSVPHWPAKVIAYAEKQEAQETREEALFGNASWERARSLPRGPAYEAADVPDEGYPDGRLAQETIQRLRRAAEHPEAPFFIAVGFVKPHLPFCAPKKYWEMYEREEFELAAFQQPPEGAPRYAPQFGGELRQYSGIPVNGPIPEELQRTLIHGYYAAVSYMDAQLGKVLEELNRLGLQENTVIVLWGDHGWHLGDHGIWCKHTNYEQAARIPLLIRAPGVMQAGSRSRALVETVDLYPTICELAGVQAEPPQGLDGESLVPLLKDPDRSGKKAVFHAYPRSPQGRNLIGRAVRTERYRLVEWKPAGGDPADADLELYDYQEDPLERRNLAGERSEALGELRAILADQPEARPQVR